MRLTEQIQLSLTKQLSKLCHLSNNLYNLANYYIWQELFYLESWVRYYDLWYMIKNKTAYIQLEILKSIINLAFDNKVRIIISYHNFDRTISYKEVSGLLNNFNNKLMYDLLIDLDKIYGCVYKIILTAQHFDDNVIVLNICKKLSQREVKFICFAMSDLGVLSRILCVKFGSLWTYGSLVEKTAPGQIKIEKIREIHQLLFEN